MILKQELVEYVSGVLAKLLFVEWDRFTFNNGLLTIFGWISRENDDYKDFVVLRFSEIEVAFIQTSSLKYSAIIGEALGTGHTACHRAETYFKIPNVVKLEARVGGGGEK